jgi:YbbR domain-containing protein
MSASWFERLTHGWVGTLTHGWVAKLSHNWVAKLGALLIAVALWLTTTNERRTTASRSLEIPLEVRGLQENRVVRDLPKTVRLQLQGARGELEQLSASNFEANIQVANRPDGFFSSDVRVDAPSNVTVLGYEPRRVSATLKSVVEQSVLVRIALLENAVALPESFTVLAIGTTEQVEQVAFALGVAGGRQTNLTPVDKDGKLVEGVRLEPSVMGLR